MVLFLGPITLVAKALSLAIVPVALLVGPVAAKKRTGAKVGDKRNGSAICTIAYTKLFTFGKTRVS